MTFRVAQLIAAILTLFIGSVVSSAQPSVPMSSDRWAAVEKKLGRSGTIQPDGAIKFGFPRTDLTVKIGDVTLRPALALGSWIAFAGTTQRDVMMMGDLVVLESEIPAVMAALRRVEIQETALHNHLLNETPHVMYMHVFARGDAVAISRGLRSALVITSIPPSASSVNASLEMDTAAIASALGAHGKLNGVVYQVSVPRRDAVKMGRETIPPSMGISTAINFQPAGDGRVATTGDFVLLPSEVNAVRRVLESGGIAVTALHSHMISESPRLLFMHFWGVGDAKGLARTLGLALGKTRSRRQ